MIKVFTFYLFQKTNKQTNNTKQSNKQTNRKQKQKTKQNKRKRKKKTPQLLNTSIRIHLKNKQTNNPTNKQTNKKPNEIRAYSLCSHACAILTSRQCRMLQWDTPRSIAGITSYHSKPLFVCVTMSLPSLN